MRQKMQKGLLKWFGLSAMLSLSLGFSSATLAEEIYTDFFSDKAVSGYDPVAYFTEGKAVKGDKDYSLEYLGANWYFSSKSNKALFEAEPDKYRPQYGGHCAWAVGANNAKAKGDPKFWRIVDDKLYLNYNQEVQDKWVADIPAFIERANKNWPSLSDK